MVNETNRQTGKLMECHSQSGYLANSNLPLHTCSYVVISNICCNNSISVSQIQYTPRNMHTVFALLCFVVVIHWLIFPYPSGLLHWHCGNLTIAQVPAKQPWWIWIMTSCEFIMNDCITTTKQSTTKPCAYISWDILYLLAVFIFLYFTWHNFRGHIIQQLFVLLFPRIYVKKHNLRHENKVNINEVLSYCQALRYM